MELNNINTLRSVTKTHLQEICDQSTSVSTVLEYFGFIPQRKDSRKLINSLILSYNIDLTKMHANFKIKFAETCAKIDRSKSFEFTKGKFISGGEIIKNLKKIKYEMKCCECGIDETYNNKPISLQVHHIDGDNTNNVIENIQILCPNCHSQTDSFCGKKNRKPLNYCRCGAQITRISKLCRKCSNEEYMLNGRPKSRKFEISKEDLEKLIADKPMTKIGKMLGVSDKAIKKRCNLLGIDIPEIKRISKMVDNATNKNTIENRRFEISKEELEKLIKEYPMTKIGKMLGVSDNAVKKRCKFYKIELKPMRGYWRKLQTGKIEREE